MGGNAAGGRSNNTEKSIITRSGIKIVFNYDQKSLHIEDPSGNTWDMDGEGNIAVNATKNMTITVGKNISVNAGQNIDETVGKDINQVANGDINESSDNRTEVVEKEYTRDAKKSDHFADEVSITTSKENIIIQSAKSVKWNSTEKSNLF